MTISVIACKTIEDEINKIYTDLKLDYHLIWIEGDLHLYPDVLRKRLQEELLNVPSDSQYLLMALGNCGGGVCGLKTGSYTTVIPLADDCISILLGSIQRRLEVSNNSSYFVTAGWLRHDNSVIGGYEEMINKYGQAKADKIHKIMMKSYQRFLMIDTEAYELEQARKVIIPMAENLGLKIDEVKASYDWLITLLKGPYDDPNRFIILPPESTLEEHHWGKLINAK